MPHDPNKEKEDLLNAIEEAEREAKRVESVAKEAIQSARLVSDIAPHLRVLYSAMPNSALSADEWFRQKQNVRSWIGAAQSIPPSHTDISSFSAMSLAAANTSISGVGTYFPLRLPSTTAPPPSPSTPVQQATVSLAAIAEKYPHMQKVQAEIRRLGLDTRGGDSKPALQLLEDARTSLDIPVVDGGGAVGVLIVLRECINACVSELIRRRPITEPAKSWLDKIASIGRRCGYSRLDAAYFANQGTEAENLINELSGAKQKGLGRPEIQWLFIKGLMFLGSFLGSIDETKLRPK